MTDLEMLNQLQDKINEARKNFEPARKNLESDIAELIKKHTDKLAMLFEFEGRNTLTIKTTGYTVKLSR